MSEVAKTGPARRGWLKASLAGLGGLLVAGCDSVTSNRSVQKIIESAEGLTRRSQRLLLTPGQLAPEFRESDLSPTFKANGTVDPQDADYRAHVASGFANWRLRVDGLVEHPMSLTLDELKARASRTQITHHDCV